MGLLSLDCTEQLNGGLWEEEEDEEGDDARFYFSLQGGSFQRFPCLKVL